MLYWPIGAGFGEGGGAGVGLVTPGVCDRPEQPSMIPPVSKIMATPMSTRRHRTAFGWFAIRYVSFRNSSPLDRVWWFTSHLRRSWEDAASTNAKSCVSNGAASLPKRWSPENGNDDGIDA